MNCLGNHPKKKMTREEILLKKRLRERERYQKMKQDPRLQAEMKEKEIMKYAQKKKKKQVKSAKDMTARELREKRKQWKVNSNAYYRRKTNPTTCTPNKPPESPLGGDHQQDNIQRNSTKKKVKRDQSKIIQRNKKLKQINQDLKRNVDKWKQRYYYRLRKEKTAVVNTSRTNANNTIVKTEIYCPEKVGVNMTSGPIFGIKEEYSIDLPILGDSLDSRGLFL